MYVEVSDEAACSAKDNPSTTGGRLDEIKEVFVPNVHLDDTPATGKSLGEGGKLCHQPFSAMSFGNRTRL